MKTHREVEMVRLLFCAAIVISGLFGGAEGKHFRGGYLSWEPIDDGLNRQVNLSFRMAYRHPFFDDPNIDSSGEEGQDCNDNVKTPILTHGRFTAETTTGETTYLFGNYPPYYTCSKIYDTGDDEIYHWSTGFNETTITLPEQEDNVWDVGLEFQQSCCWIDELINYKTKPKRWYLRTMIDLTPRPDLGNRPNSSPYVQGLPVKTVIQQCATSIPLNAKDPDKDQLKCRWTKKRKGECEENEDNCGNPDPTIFEMQKDACIIDVNAKNAKAGLYAVAVMIEDFPTIEKKRIKPYSKISYQFLVNIKGGDIACDRVVTLEPVPACYVVPFVINPPFRFNLYGRTNISVGEPIVSFDVEFDVVQLDMNMSRVMDDGDGLYHVEVSWRPSGDLFGTVQQLCYRARDVENIEGELKCVKLSVGGVAPKPEPLPSTPSSNQSIKVGFDTQLFQLYFTEEVQLSLDQYNGTVTFLHPNGEIVKEVKITKDNLGNVSTEEPYFVQFSTSQFLEHNTTYTIRLATGVVKGATGCHLPSEEKEWQFTTDIFTGGGPIPIEDRISIECKPTFMITYIASDQLPDGEQWMYPYNDTYCNTARHNETHIAIRSMYGKCGTRAIVNEDKTRVSMVNDLYLSWSNSEGGFTRSEIIPVVRVNCSIPTPRVSYVEFNTNSSTFITAEKHATGNSNFSLKMYKDSEYSKLYSVEAFPVVVQRDDVLYIEAQTFNTSSNFELFLEECVATPTAGPGDSLKYILIRDGCPLDDTVESQGKDRDRIRFSVVPFSFVGHNQQSSIFVYCTMRDCDKRDGSCDTNCPELQPNLKRSMSRAASLKVALGAARRATDDHDDDDDVSRPGRLLTLILLVGFPMLVKKIIDVIT